MAWRGIWFLALALALGLYGTMAFWSLPHLSDLAGGMVPFDLRPTGYDTETARRLIAALGVEGRAFYLDVQHRLDTVYPPARAVVLAGAALRLAPGRVGIGLALAAAAAAGFDWAENLAVAELLRAGPEGFDPALAARASLFTVAKSALTTLVMVALLLLGLRAGWRRWGGRLQAGGKAQD